MTGIYSFPSRTVGADKPLTAAVDNALRQSDRDASHYRIIHRQTERDNPPRYEYMATPPLLQIVPVSFPFTIQTECGAISPQENYVFWNGRRAETGSLS
jgi:hypothetical protein